MSIADQLTATKQRIQMACNAVGRDIADIHLMAVTKQQQPRLFQIIGCWLSGLW